MPSQKSFRWMFVKYILGDMGCCSTGHLEQLVGRVYRFSRDGKSCCHITGLRGIVGYNKVIFDFHMGLCVMVCDIMSYSKKTSSTVYKTTKNLKQLY